MPHASDSDDEKGYNYVERSQVLNTMLREGRSWSGRERNCCFLNTGLDPQQAGAIPWFANISAVSGLDFLDDGRAMVPVDWDHDGDLDLWTSNRNAPRLRFMQNQVSQRGTSGRARHFLAVKLQGNGTTTNRDGIGARVEVVLNGSTIENSELTDNEEDSQPSTHNFQPLMKTLHAGEGFLSQGSKWLHFGLGATSHIEKVIVRWPGGEKQEFIDLEANSRYQLIQGQSQAVAWQRPAKAESIVASPQTVPPQSGTARVPLIVPLPLPNFEYPDFSQVRHDLRTSRGNPLLISLWASWCTPCLEELKQFRDHEQKLRKRGLNILALSIDGLDNKPSDLNKVRTLIHDMGFPFDVGRAMTPHVDFLQNVHNCLMSLGRPLPLPTSFLVDGEGKLQIIYKGPVEVDTLLRDLEHLERSGNADRSSRLRWAASRDGTTIDHEQVKFAADFEEVKLRFQFASLLSQVGQTLEAAKQYQNIIRIAPGFAKAYNSLGAMHYRLGKKQHAFKFYEKSRQLDANAAEVHYNLGILHLDFKKPAQAQTYFENAVRLRPNYADAQCDLGTALAVQGDLQAAIERFEKALRIEPNHRARQNLQHARALLKQ